MSRGFFEWADGIVQTIHHLQGPTHQVLARRFIETGVAHILKFSQCVFRHIEVEIPVGCNEVTDG